MIFGEQKLGDKKKIEDVKMMIIRRKRNEVWEK